MGWTHRIGRLCVLILKSIDTAAAVIAPPPDAAKSGAFSDLTTTTSLNRLVARFLAHIEVETK